MNKFLFDNNPSFLSGVSGVNWPKFPVCQKVNKLPRSYNQHPQRSFDFWKKSSIVWRLERDLTVMDISSLIVLEQIVVIPAGCMGQNKQTVFLVRLWHSSLSGSALLIFLSFSSTSFSKVQKRAFPATIRWRLISSSNSSWWAFLRHRLFPSIELTVYWHWLCVRRIKL